MNSVLVQSQLDNQHGNALLDFMTSRPSVCPFVYLLARFAIYIYIHLSIYHVAHTITEPTDSAAGKRKFKQPRAGSHGVYAT